MRAGTGPLPHIVLVGGLAISLLVALWVSRLEHDVNQHAFASETNKIAYAVQQEVVELEANLNAAAVYADESPDTRAEQFKQFISTLFAGKPHGACRRPDGTESP